MSNQNTTDDPSTPPEGDTTPPEGTPAPPVDPPADPPQSGAKPEDELPEWARTELTRARGDAARYRTALREAEAKLANAKTPEEFEAAVSEFKTRNADLEREVLVSKVARRHELPDELAEVLKGATEEELDEHAKRLKRFTVPATREPADLNGGLNPGGDDDEPNDPRALARKYGRGRRRSA